MDNDNQAANNDMNAQPPQGDPDVTAISPASADGQRGKRETALPSVFEKEYGL